MKKNQSSEKKTPYKPSKEARALYPDAKERWIKWYTCPACKARPYQPCTNKAGRKLGHNRYHRSRIDVANREFGIEKNRQAFDKALAAREDARKARRSWSAKDGPRLYKCGSTWRGTGVELIGVNFPVREMVRKICENPEYRTLLFEYLALEASNQEQIDYPDQLIAEERAEI